MGIIARRLLFQVALVGPLLAQEPQRPPELLFPGGADNWHLTRIVELRQPTIVIVIQVPRRPLSELEIKSVRTTGDSLQAVYQETARRRGYGFEVRVTGYEGIQDREGNAFHRASLIEDRAVIIARPGALPRLVRYWPEPYELFDELEDYERVYRLLTPT
jgi:hypothetical protein